jgi:hypothetical protein
MGIRGSSTQVHWEMTSRREPGWCLIVLLGLRCGNESTRAGTGVDPGGPAAQADAGMAEARCPNGALPDDTSLGAKCPIAIPAAGSCCGLPGLACPYPNGDDLSTPFSICFEDPQHPPYWQITSRLDKRICSRANEAGILLELDGGSACSDRPASSCAPDGVNSAQTLLDGELDAIVTRCGGIPNESLIEVEYSDGCPTKVVPHLSVPTPSLTTCIIAALSSLRSGCAIGLTCAYVERTTLQ